MSVPVEPPPQYPLPETAGSSLISVSAYEKDIVSSLETLTDDFLCIKEQFELVRTALSAIDATSNTSYLGHTRPLFASKWEALYQLYLEILSLLRESATDGSVHVKQYLDVVIPMLQDPQMGYAERREEIAYFIQNVENAKSHAEDYFERFNSLHQQLQAFSKEFTAFVVKVGRGLNAEIEKADKYIKSMEDQLNQLKETSQELTPSFQPVVEIVTDNALKLAKGAAKPTAGWLLGIAGGQAVTGAVGGMTILTWVAPIAIVTAAMVATGYSVHQITKATKAFNEMTKTATELSRVQSELSLLLAKSTDASIVKASVGLVTKGIHHTIPRVGHIVDVEELILGDARDLQGLLNELKDLGAAELSLKLAAYRSTISETYEVLKQVLDVIATKVQRRHTSRIVSPSGGHGAGDSDHEIEARPLTDDEYKEEEDRFKKEPLSCSPDALGRFIIWCQAIQAWLVEARSAIEKEGSTKFDEEIEAANSRLQVVIERQGEVSKTFARVTLQLCTQLLNRMLGASINLDMDDNVQALLYLFQASEQFRRIL